MWEQMKFEDELAKAEGLRQAARRKSYREKYGKQVRELRVKIIRVKNQLLSLSPEDCQKVDENAMGPYSRLYRYRKKCMLKAVDNLPSLRVECLEMWESIRQENKEKTETIPVGDEENEMADVVEGVEERREMDVEGEERGEDGVCEEDEDEDEENGEDEDGMLCTDDLLMDSYPSLMNIDIMNENGILGDGYDNVLPLSTFSIPSMQLSMDSLSPLPVPSSVSLSTSTSTSTSTSPSEGRSSRYGLRQVKRKNYAIMANPVSKAKRVRRSKKADNATQHEGQEDSPGGQSEGVQYITEKDIEQDKESKLPYSRSLLNALKAIYFYKAIWPSRKDLSKTPKVEEISEEDLMIRPTTKQQLAEAYRKFYEKTMSYAVANMVTNENIFGALSVVYFQYLRM